MPTDLGLADLGSLFPYIESMLWAMLRIGGMVMVAPIIGIRLVPGRVRVLIAVAIVLAAGPMLPQPAVMTALGSQWVLSIVHELLIGVAFGFVFLLVFEAMAFAGEVISVGMGLSFAQIADPVRGVQGTVVSQFFLLIAAMLFFAHDAHLGLIRFTVQSFEVMPIGEAYFDAASALALAKFLGKTLIVALQMALPAVTAMLAINLAFGVVGRAAPSMNLITVGFPVALFFGFYVLTQSVTGLEGPFLALIESAWSLLDEMVSGR